jgi:peptidoglycan/LPS O-acetylase OafA/YrhL
MAPQMFLISLVIALVLLPWMRERPQWRGRDALAVLAMVLVTAAVGKLFERHGDPDNAQTFAQAAALCLGMLAGHLVDDARRRRLARQAAAAGNPVADD